MGTLQIGAENAPANNVAVDAANGGGLAPGTAGGAYFLTASARQGLYGYWINGGGLQTAVAAQAPAAGNTMRTRIYFRYAARPTGNLGRIVYITRENGTLNFGVRLQSTGTLVLEDAAAATPFISTFVTQPNTWYRLELNFAPSTTNAANSKIMLWCGPAATNPVATNGTAQAYYYSTTFQGYGTAQTAVAPGLGYYAFGNQGGSTQFGGAVWDFDDVAVDNGTFTNVTTTWWGKATPIVSDVWLARGTPAAAIAGSSVRVVSDLFTPRATPVFSLTASPIQKSAAISMAALAVKLIPNATVSHDYGWLSSVAGALALDGTVPRNYVLPVRGVPGLVVNAAGLVKTATLPLAAAAALANAGFRGQSSGVSMAALASALYGPTLDVQGLLGMVGPIGFQIAADQLWQDFFLADTVAALELGALRTASPGLAVRGLPALLVAGALDQPRGLAVRGTPVLLLGGRKDTTAAVAAAVVARLTVAGRLTISPTLVMGVIARMIHFGANIGERRTYDNVLALILRNAVAARIFELGLMAEVLDNGARRADVLGGPFQAVPRPSGMLAIIQD